MEQPIGVLTPVELYQQIPDHQDGMTFPSVISVLYARLSKEDKDKIKEDDSDSIVNQKKILAKFAREHQLPNPVFFTDDGISGTTFDRKDFQAAMGLVSEGTVKNFVVKDLSRFGRDHIKVDTYLEELLTEMDVRFIAIYDGVDSSRSGDSDMVVPIRNLFNEWYPKDTSKKVRHVLHEKGMRGESLCTQPYYGYLYDPENRKKKIVDEEAAAIVQRIFQHALEGLGPTHIAKLLENERIICPSHHMAHKGITPKIKLPADPYEWSVNTVARILSRREYLGCTVNFKTYSKSYKTRKRFPNAPENQVVFENTHPAIVDQDVFDRVQQLRSGKRRHSNSGRVELFSGIVYCADCGSKLYFSSGSSMKPQQDHYVCSGFRSKNVNCQSAHYIRVATLKQYVLEEVQDILTVAAEHTAAVIEHLQQGDRAKQQKELAAGKKRLAQSQSRITELDRYIQRLYEDNVNGKLTDERFMKLSQGYEQEQKELQEQTAALQKQLASQEAQTLNVKHFLSLVRKYAGMTELTPEALHELVERIEVHAPDRRSGVRRQAIDIHMNFIGAIGKLELRKLQSKDSSAS